MSLGLGIPGAEGGTMATGTGSAWAEVWGAFWSQKREWPGCDVRSTCLRVSLQLSLAMVLALEALPPGPPAWCFLVI